MNHNFYDIGLFENFVQFFWGPVSSMFFYQHNAEVMVCGDTFYL